MNKKFLIEFGFSTRLMIRESGRKLEAELPGWNERILNVKSSKIIINENLLKFVLGNNRDT